MNQRLTEQRHITCGTELPRRVQPVDGLERGVGQAQFLRVAVHQADERILATRHEIGNRDTGVVTGLNNDPFIEVSHRNLIAWLEEHQ